MSGVSTKISVMDAMTPAIEHMYRGVSQLISGMYKLNEATKNSIDMSPFIEAQKSMAEAVAVQKQLENGYTKVAESTRQAQSAQNIYNDSIKEAERIQNTFKWNRINSMEIFSGTGIERYRKELADLNSFTERIRANQQAISSNVMNSLYNGIYPRADAGAFNDFDRINNRVSELVRKMGSVSAIDISGFTAVNQAVLNREIETLRAYEREVLNVQADLSINMSNGNVKGMNSDVEKLNILSEQLESRLRGVLETAHAMGTVSWDNINNVEVFNSAGIERAEQEANALRLSLENVINAQRTLTENAAGMKLLPRNAVNDITGLNNRIAALQGVLVNMETRKNKLSKWDTNGINRYNANAEQLRKAMAQIENVQKDINKAVENNEIDRVNIGYQRLNSLVNTVETSIRNNTTEQDRFNRSVSTGANNVLRLGDNLKNNISRYITMAVSAYSGKQFINASDTWTNNSSRLGLITDNLQEQNVLQQKLYQSAKETRGAYNDMVDVTAKLGLLAGEVFGSNAEIVKFTELMQKSFKLSGASTMERQSAMYQLTQAMAAGKLQGDEFRSIMENAPMLASAIADYTGVSKGELKELSSDGVITADIIKNALFLAADDIESKFKTMPLTFGEAWNNVMSDATMAFAPVYESMNDMLNSGIIQGVIAEIPALFEQAALKVQEMLSVIEGTAIAAGPGLSTLASAVGDIANAMFSANGVAGNFIRTIGQFASNPATAKAVRNLGGSFITVANALSSVLQVATPLLPAITNLYIGFKMYDTISPILSNVATGIANVVNVVSGLQYVLYGAATAQEALNFAMESNPYLGVASAIAKVVTAMVALIGTIKAVSNAADLAENSGVEATVEASKYAREHGVDLKTAQSVLNSNDSFEQQRGDLAESLNLIRQERESIEFEIEQLKQGNYSPALGYNQGYTQKYINENREAVEEKVIQPRIKELNEELLMQNQKLQEVSLALVDLDKSKRETEQFYLEMYEQQHKNWDGISDDPNDYFKAFDGFDVDNVENVNHINDTVDIASEDLRYLRELADQETINEFTSKLLQPQINVSFGEVRETADVDEILKRITDELTEDLNNSGDLLHF